MRTGACQFISGYILTYKVGGILPPSRQELPPSQREIGKLPPIFLPLSDVYNARSMLRIHYAQTLCVNLEINSRACLTQTRLLLIVD